MRLTNDLTNHTLTNKLEMGNPKKGKVMNNSSRRKRIPWFIWPFYAIWRLVLWILNLVGRTVALILGLVFVFVGVLLSLTIVGAIVGIPLGIVGLLLFIAALR